MAGGTEKLPRRLRLRRPGSTTSSRRRLRELEPELVLDLSDEPVLGPRGAVPGCRAVCSRPGSPYAGADFRFEPPELEAVPAALAGGVRDRQARRQDRCVCAHRAAALARSRCHCGGDGPGRAGDARGRRGRRRASTSCWRSRAQAVTRRPTISRSPPSPASSRSAAGAAAVGWLGPLQPRTFKPGQSWRCTGGPELRRLRRQRRGDSAGRDRQARARHEHLRPTGPRDRLPERVPHPARRPRARDDGGCVDPHEALADAIREVKPDVTVIAVGFRPRPLASIDGKRVAYFTTAAPSAARGGSPRIWAEYGAEVIHVSGNLADRPALQRELETVDADVYLTEIKAAGIDVVAEAGAKRGVEIVLAANDLVHCPGQPELDPALLAPRSEWNARRSERDREAPPRAAAARRRGRPALLEGPARTGRDRDRRAGREGVRARPDGRGRSGRRGKPRLLARTAAGAGGRDVGKKRAPR